MLTNALPEKELTCPENRIWQMIIGAKPPPSHRGREALWREQTSSLGDSFEEGGAQVAFAGIGEDGDDGLALVLRALGDSGGDGGGGAA